MGTPDFDQLPQDPQKAQEALMQKMMMEMMMNVADSDDTS